MIKAKAYWILVVAAVVFCVSVSNAQVKDEAYALDIVNKALGNIGDEPNYGIYFEGIAFGISKPKDIFKLPSYEVYRGGYLYNDGDKFEIQLGIMKALCDGKLMVMVDEQSKMMVIDSLRDKVPGNYEVPDIQKIIDEKFGNGSLVYEGNEVVNSRNCHRIKAAFDDEQNSHVYYWVDVEKGTLLLMAEWQNNAYDAYWIKKVTRAPKGYLYKINVPKHEVESLYGYEVFDFRFTSDKLNKPVGEE